MNEGIFVTWQPVDPHRIFPEATAETLSARLPLQGMMKRIDGQIGLMSYIAPSGKKAELPVRLDEITTVVLS